MKRYIVTGLIILLPFVLTLVIVAFILKILTYPLLGSVETILAYYGLFSTSFLFFDSSEIFFLMSRLIALLSLGIVIVTIGFLGRLVIVNSILRQSDRLIKKIPFVKSLYRATQETAQTLLNAEKISFSKVVVLPFFTEAALAIGFVPDSEEKKSPNELISVYIPGAPNPMMGFIFNCYKRDLNFVAITADEALKFIISCGVMELDFQKGTELEKIK